MKTKTKYPDQSFPSGWSTDWLRRSADEEVLARITPFGIALIFFDPPLNSAFIEFAYRGQLHTRWPVVTTRRGAIIAATKLVKEIVAKNLKAGSK
jgi:hypothetical protein